MEKVTWKDIVARALDELGGQANLNEINKQVESTAANHERFATNPTWQATIRRTLQQYNIFEPVERGIWRLTDFQTPQPESQTLEAQESEINHDIAQGMLVALGNIYGYQTFTPKNDQTMREFQGKKLKEWVTVKDCIEVFDSSNIQRIELIDVLWFDEDDDGLYPTYAFEVEHSTKIKDGLDRLLKIPQRLRARLYILGAGQKESELFHRLVRQTPFREYQERFYFKFYKDLENTYNLAVKHSLARTHFLER
jgi:hypothetical protein